MKANFIFASVVLGGLLTVSCLSANAHDTDAPSFEDLNLTPSAVESEEEERVEIKVPRVKVKKTKVAKTTRGYFDPNQKVPTNLKTTCIIADYIAPQDLVSGEYYVNSISIPTGTVLQLPNLYDKNTLIVVPKKCRSIKVTNGRIYIQPNK